VTQGLFFARIYMAFRGLCQEGRKFELRRIESAPYQNLSRSQDKPTVRASNQQRKSAAMLGVAFDNDDGHTRLTKGKNFVLCGGSQETHGVMQETAVKINEHLDKRGKRLEDVPIGELRQICRDVSDSVGGGQ